MDRALRSFNVNVTLRAERILERNTFRSSLSIGDAERDAYALLGLVRADVASQW